MATAIPVNRARMTVRQVAQAAGATIVGAEQCQLSGVTTDTRSELQDRLFVALTGDHFDGHAYVTDAVARGAAAVLVERDEIPPLSVPVLRVPSTLRALGDIARLHRQNWRGQLIAVAGSAGKTTTRVAIEAVLRAIAGTRVHATQGNLNNQIGVPMTLLGLTDQHQYAVVEVGTNALGEVERLGHVCSPNISVLTLIGLEHTEGLGDLDGVEQEEGHIFAALADGGMAIGNGDDPRVIRQMQLVRNPGQRRTYGTQPTADYFVQQQVAHGLDRTLVTIRRGDHLGQEPLALETRLLGTPGALAVAAAVAVVEALGLTIDVDCANAELMRGNLGEAGRLKIHQTPDGTVILDDSYNANPPSMLSSISLANSLALRKAGRLILVLGEMRELGEHSEREHANLGRHLGQVAHLVAVGAQAEPLYHSAQRCYKSSSFASDAREAAELLLNVVRPADVVLVKGSRGMHLETVVEALMVKKGCAS